MSNKVVETNAYVLNVQIQQGIIHLTVRELCVYLGRGASNSQLNIIQQTDTKGFSDQIPPVSHMMVGDLIIFFLYLLNYG